MTNEQEQSATDRPATLTERLCGLLRPFTPADEEPMDPLNDPKEPIPTYDEWARHHFEEHPDVADALRETIEEFDDLSDFERGIILEQLGREYVPEPETPEHYVEKR